MQNNSKKLQKNVRIDFQVSSYKKYYKMQTHAFKFLNLNLKFSFVKLNKILKIDLFFF